ncbi:MAG: SGNH/GDSL hydrolase family protein [Oligoflexales bacterium]|nr:SGNH/GDSL hydrolase family protein [Oligoflexales bacterium]
MALILFRRILLTFLMLMVLAGCSNTQTRYAPDNGDSTLKSISFGDFEDTALQKMKSFNMATIKITCIECADFEVGDIPGFDGKTKIRLGRDKSFSALSESLKERDLKFNDGDKITIDILLYSDLDQTRPLYVTCASEDPQNPREGCRDYIHVVGGEGTTFKAVVAFKDFTGGSSPSGNSGTDKTDVKPAESQTPAPASPATGSSRKLNSGSGGVHMIGDSIFRHGQMIENNLKSLSGMNIVNHATNGHRMNDIKNQYQNIRNQNVKIIVMDGGGNDVLGARETCATSLTSRCREVLDSAIGTLREILDMMDQDGVHYVVFSGYYYAEPSKWNFMTHAYATQGDYREALDYATEKEKAICEGAKIKCVMVDVRKISSQGQSYTDDGVHPNSNTAKAMAEMIWQKMRENQIK